MKQLGGGAEGGAGGPPSPGAVSLLQRKPLFLNLSQLQYLVFNGRINGNSSRLRFHERGLSRIMVVMTKLARARRSRSIPPSSYGQILWKLTVNITKLPIF